jgi:hypothetical protein
MPNQVRGAAPCFGRPCDDAWARAGPSDGPAGAAAWHRRVGARLLPGACSPLLRGGAVSRVPHATTRARVCAQQYRNVRPDYLKAIWTVINWRNVEERYTAASKKKA